ncbi:hypothetical protein EVAR_58838_1 [Eumeta japonica]|uniref:Uncharacterized protein n=1 Tax=Eumeta variegata TaxID=151549 RepID=A0A4C1YRB2_EUMVA|nr:hypothetical protein EVAR_58838_1 [Eumeta japonica]
MHTFRNKAKPLMKCLVRFLRSSHNSSLSAPRRAPMIRLDSALFARELTLNRQVVNHPSNYNGDKCEWDEKRAGKPVENKRSTLMDTSDPSGVTSEFLASWKGMGYLCDRGGITTMKKGEGQSANGTLTHRTKRNNESC